jgi:hypothetical protein
MRGILLGAVLAAVCLPLGASDDGANINVDEVIHKFAAKETEFAQARNNYTYRQSVKLQELDPAGNPAAGYGLWEQVSDILFSPEGKRMEHVVYAPVQNLQHLVLTPEDMQDLVNVNPFVLTTAEIPEFDIHYLGREKVDEISCYNFSIKPKKLVPGKRYFEGQLWVDDRDLQIVKTYGKGVGYIKKSSDNQFAKFETYREQIDGKYWFPTYSRADDTLHFKTGEAQRIRQVIRWTDYKRYEGRSTIRFGDVVPDDKSKTTTPPPTTKKQ